VLWTKKTRPKHLLTKALGERIQAQPGLVRSSKEGDKYAAATPQGPPRLHRRTQLPITSSPGFNGAVDVLTWGPPSATGMTPYLLGIAPSTGGQLPKKAKG
jgi:hypothetical protein